MGGGGSRLRGPPIVGASRDRSRMLEFLDRVSFRCRKQWVSGGVIFIGGLARGLFMCSFRDSSSLVTYMQASVEVAGTGIGTTRCTIIVNQRFCARVWMANVPLDCLRIASPVTENHSKKTYESRQWRSSAISVSYTHLTLPTIYSV